VPKPEASRKEVSFYCTDNRDGEARLLVVESRRPGDSSSIETKQILKVAVSSQRSEGIVRLLRFAQQGPEGRGAEPGSWVGVDWGTGTA